MVNIFEVYQKHANIPLDNIKIKDGEIEFISDDSLYTFHFEKKIGANFSSYPRITNRLNIFTDEEKVYYIEALHFFDIFSLELNSGVHFSQKSYFSEIGFNLVYQKNENLEFGLGLSDFTNFGQTNASIFCDYTRYNIVNIIAGINLHKQWVKRDLGKYFDFPKDHQIYKMENGYYSSFFINPGIEFQSGKFSIRQGIEADFIFLFGENIGIAHQTKAILQLSYRLF